VLAEFELVAQRRELRPVSARIFVRSRLGEGDAPRVIGQLVVKGGSGIDFVVQVPAVNGRAIGMVREPVQVQIELV